MKLLILPFISSLLLAQAVDPKVMRAKDSKKYSHYQHSGPSHTTEGRVISSSAEASGQVTVMVTIQATSEITSGRHGGHATMGFLDNNRMEITEEIAKGEGEHLETLLSMMELNNDAKSLEIIQKHFDELIYLSHNDFLDKLETLI